MDPLLNNPFWSLGYEAVYYVAAGLIFFTQGWTRILSLGVLCALAGPEILSLAPIWFLGFGVYHLKDRLDLSATAGGVLAVVGLAMLAAAPVVRGFTDSLILSRYFEAIAFCINLIGVLQIGPYLERALNWCARPVRFLSALTFPLYLFHWPIILVLTATKLWPIDTWQHQLYIFVVPLLIVASFGWWCDQQKSTIKRWLTIKTLELRRQQRAAR